MMFDFGKYCFIKLKLKFWNFLSEQEKIVKYDFLPNFLVIV